MDIAAGYGVWGFWAVIAQWVFNIIISGCVYFARRQAATNRRVDKVNARIENTEKEMIKIREKLEQQPSQRQFENLGRDIRSLTSELGEVKGRLEGINRVADLMNEFLINQGGKRHG